jgi:hypothetical protein
MKEMAKQTIDLFSDFFHTKQNHFASVLLPTKHKEAHLFYLRI